MIAFFFVCSPMNELGLRRLLSNKWPKRSWDCKLINIGVVIVIQYSYVEESYNVTLSPLSTRSQTPEG